MPCCQVPGCDHLRGVKLNGKSLFFFAIPDPNKSTENAELCKAWLRAIGTTKYDPDKYEYHRDKVVCECHFSPENFQEDMMARLIGTKPRKKLKPNAVPSVFFSKAYRKRESSEKKSQCSTKSKKLYKSHRKKNNKIKIASFQHKKAVPDVVEIFGADIPAVIKVKTGSDAGEVDTRVAKAEAVYPVSLTGPVPAPTPIQEVQNLVNCILKANKNKCSHKSSPTVHSATEKSNDLLAARVTSTIGTIPVTTVTRTMATVPVTPVTATMATVPTTPIAGTMATVPATQKSQPVQVSTNDVSSCLMATYYVVIPSAAGNTPLQFDGPVWVKNGNLTLGNLPMGLPPPAGGVTDDKVQLMLTTDASSPTGSSGVQQSHVNTSTTAAGNTSQQTPQAQNGLRSVMATYHVFLPSTTPGLKTFAMSCQGPVWVKDMPQARPKVAPKVLKGKEAFSTSASAEIKSIAEQVRAISGTHITPAIDECSTKILSQNGSGGSMALDRSRPMVASVTNFGSMAIERTTPTVGSMTTFGSVAIERSMVSPMTNVGSMAINRTNPNVIPATNVGSMAINRSRPTIIAVDRSRPTVVPTTNVGSLALDRSRPTFGSMAINTSRPMVGSMTNFGSLVCAPSTEKEGLRIIEETMIGGWEEQTVRVLLEAKRLAAKNSRVELECDKERTPVSIRSVVITKKRKAKQPRDPNIVEDYSVDLVLGKHPNTFAFQDELPETFYVLDEDEPHVLSDEEADKEETGSPSGSAEGTLQANYAQKDSVICSTLSEDKGSILSLLESMLDTISSSVSNDNPVIRSGIQQTLGGGEMSEVEKSSLLHQESCLVPGSGGKTSSITDDSTVQPEQDSHTAESKDDRGTSPSDSDQQLSTQTGSSERSVVNPQSESMTDCAHQSPVNDSQDTSDPSTRDAPTEGSEAAVEGTPSLVLPPPDTDSDQDEDSVEEVGEDMSAQETEAPENTEPSTLTSGSERGTYAALRKSSRKRKIKNLDIQSENEISTRKRNSDIRKKLKKADMGNRPMKPGNEMSSLEIVLLDHLYAESEERKDEVQISVNLEPQKKCNTFLSRPPAPLLTRPPAPQVVEKVDTILTPYGSVKVSDSVQSIEESNQEEEEEEERDDSLDYLDEIFIDDGALDDDGDSDYCPYPNKVQQPSSDDEEESAEEAGEEAAKEVLDDLLVEKERKHEEKPKKTRFKKTRVTWRLMSKSFTCKLCDLETSSSKSICHHLLKEHKKLTTPLLKVLKKEKVPDPESNQTLYDFVFGLNGDVLIDGDAAENSVASSQPADQRGGSDEGASSQPADQKEGSHESASPSAGTSDGGSQADKETIVAKDGAVETKIKQKEVSSSQEDEDEAPMEFDSGNETEGKDIADLKLLDEKCESSGGAPAREDANQGKEVVYGDKETRKRNVTTVSQINCEALTEEEALYMEFLCLETEKVFPSIQRYIKTCLTCPKCDVKRRNPRVTYKHCCEDVRKDFLCEGCGRTFSRVGYNCHIKSCQEREGTKEQTSCKFCGRIVSKKTLQRHIERQHSEKSWREKVSCTICGKVIGSKRQCELHEAKHRTDFPFKCSFCQKGFVQKGNMRNHMRQHTGEQPYKCQHCTKSFTHNVSLKNHLKRYHQIDLWKDGYQGTKRTKRKRTTRKNK